MASMNVDIPKFLAPGAKREDIQEKVSALALMQMIEEGLQADITLTAPAAGGSVKAHRSVLAAVSPIFNTSQNPQELPDNMTLEGLQLFLLLLYIVPDHKVVMPELKEAVDKHFLEIFQACQVYQVIRLVPTLNDALPRNMTPENCWDFIEMCLGIQVLYDQRRPVDRRSYVNLYTTWACYIMENCDKVMDSVKVEEMMRRDPSTVRYFMAELTMLLKEVLPKDEDGATASVVTSHYDATLKRSDR